MNRREVGDDAEKKIVVARQHGGRCSHHASLQALILLMDDFLWMSGVNLVSNDPPNSQYMRVIEKALVGHSNIL